MESIRLGSFQFRVKRSPRRRQLSLHVRPDGSLWLLANQTLSQKKMIRFVEQQWDWVLKAQDSMNQLQKKYPPKKFKDGETYPYLGKSYTLRLLPSDHLSLKLTDEEMHFHLPESTTALSAEKRDLYKAQLLKAYKVCARELLNQRVTVQEKRMGLKCQGVSFRLQKTLWGSCSPTNRISLNMKLIVAPLEVIDYVVIHELAHIVHKNHSKRFWELVEAHTSHRHWAAQWLRENHYAGEFLASSSELHLK